jgi:hypothetical protein
MKKVLLTVLGAALIAGTVTIAQAKKIEDLNVDISGTAQFGYNIQKNQGPGVSGILNDQFDVNRLRLKLAAQPADKIKFNGQVELGRMQGFGADNVLSGAGVADSRIVDAAVTLDYLKWVSFKVGQLAVPYSYELNEDEYGLETINYSQLVGPMAGRDKGAAAIIPFVKEVTGIAWIRNGVGTVGGATAENNDSKNYGAMLSVDPIKDLNIKAFGDMGKNSVGAAFTKNALIGIGADYKIAGWHFRSEVIQASSKTPAAVKTKARDWYLQGSVKIPQSAVQLVARYDNFNPSTKAVPKTDTKITTLGVNWDFEKDARLQFNHEFRSESPTSVKNDTTMLQLSVRF